MKTNRSQFIASLIILTITSCSNTSNPLNREVARLTEQELRQQLNNIECINYNDKLDGKLSYKPVYNGLLSLKVKGINFSCNISNSAAIATYHDIAIHVKFISKTKTPIMERDFTIYEFIGPSKTISYENEIAMSNFDYEDIENFEWRITSVKCK